MDLQAVIGDGEWCVAHMTAVVSHHKPGDNSLTDKYYNHSVIITWTKHSVIWKKQAVCCQWFQACYSCWGSSEKRAQLFLSWWIDGAVERINSVLPWQTNTGQVVWIWLHLKALWICHSVCSYKDCFVLFVPCWKGRQWKGSGSLILTLFHVSIVHNISTLPNKARFPVLQNNDKSTSYD